MFYTTLLFDLDDTLLDFGKAEKRAFFLLAKKYRWPQSRRVYKRYHVINIACWQEMEKGLMPREKVLTERFRRLCEEFGFPNDAQELEDFYMAEICNGHFKMPGAMRICKKLSRSYEVDVVTNGVARSQYRRIRESGLGPYLKKVFISEELGFNKPDIRYFEKVFDGLVEKDKSKILLIGDSLSGDIKGAENAGIDAVWMHRKSIASVPNTAKYEITGLKELNKILK